MRVNDDLAKPVIIHAGWRIGATVTVGNEHGLEFILLPGNASADGGEPDAQSRGRLRAGQALEATAGPQGALVWLKGAPLLHENVLQSPQ